MRSSIRGNPNQCPPTMSDRFDKVFVSSLIWPCPHCDKDQIGVQVLVSEKVRPCPRFDKDPIGSKCRCPKRYDPVQPLPRANKKDVRGSPCKAPQRVLTNNGRLARRPTT